MGVQWSKKGSEAGNIRPFQAKNIPLGVENGIINSWTIVR